VTVKPPFVSVAIINYNYSQFLAAAIQSVKDQTYRNFECIVVDNGSVDDSVAVAAAAIAGDPQFAIHRLEKNLGHLGGGLWSLPHLRGEFVVFLDADDFLFPDYLQNHLQVHIATTYPCGFTSSLCVEVDGADALLTGSNSVGRRTAEIGRPCLGQVAGAIRLAAFDENRYSGLVEAARFLPAAERGWRWCPGSSNMFRRSLIERVRPATTQDVLYGGVDGYFMPIMHAVTGSIVIDRPLSAYRVHRANSFSTLPMLNTVRTAARASDASVVDIHHLQLITIIGQLESMPFEATRLWEVLEVVASYQPMPTLPCWRHPEVIAAVTNQYGKLADVFSERTVLAELRRRLPLKDCLTIALDARHGRSRAATLRRAMTMGLKPRLGRK
jgi:glycosyltransferase involved in cell wall biosynthesis